MPSRGLTRRDRTVYNIACSCAHCMFTSRPEGQKSTTSEKGVGQHVSVSTRMYRRQPLPSAIRVWSQTRPPREHALREISIFLFAASPPLSLSVCENYRHHLPLQFLFLLLGDWYNLSEKGKGAPISDRFSFERSTV